MVGRTRGCVLHGLCATNVSFAGGFVLYVCPPGCATERFSCSSVRLTCELFLDDPQRDTRGAGTHGVPQGSAHVCPTMIPTFLCALLQTFMYRIVRDCVMPSISVACLVCMKKPQLSCETNLPISPRIAFALCAICVARWLSQGAAPCLAHLRPPTNQRTNKQFATTIVGWDDRESRKQPQRVWTDFFSPLISPPWRPSNIPSCRPW